MKSNVSPTEVAEKLAKMFLQTLKKGEYIIDVGDSSHMRVTGVMDGELFFALSCKVFYDTAKNDKP